MTKFKNLKTTIETIEEFIAQYIQQLNGKYQIDKKSETFYQYKIIIPGKSTALLNVYKTNKGITINPKVGTNQKLSVEIAELISENSKKVETTSQNFEGVFPELFNEFLSEFKENGVQVTKTQDLEHTKTYKLKDNVGYELTINYYPDKNKILIQGKTTRLYDDVILWFTDKTIENPQDIVEIIFNSLEDFNKYDIKFPDMLITKQLEEKLGEFYSDVKIMIDPERKWLKTSFYLLYFEKDLPEYYPVVAGSIKVIEGILRRLLLKKYGNKAFKQHTKAFQHFEFDKHENKFKLKNRYIPDFKDKNHIVLIENLYNFIYNTRNKYAHNMGIFPYTIESRGDAEMILNDVVELIRQTGKNKEGLL